MKNTSFDVPVIFIIFNRPDTTRIVFEAIKQIKPKKVYVIADGPRSNNPDDITLCAKTREIVEKIDWDCEKFFNFSDNNLGCGVRISSGITWVFERESQAIILEDDCVPCNAFFWYCKEMLERYKDDTRIWAISGNQYNEEAVTTPHSYFFSKYVHIWGWATWKRCWQESDIKMEKYPLLLQQNLLTSLFGTKEEALYFDKIFEIYFNKGKSEKFDTWDFQFFFASVINSHICVVPTKNLVKNIGYIGTHAEMKNRFHDRPVDENYKIISHPDFVLCDVNYDAYHFKHHWNEKIPLFKRIIRKIRKIIWIKKSK